MPPEIDSNLIASCEFPYVLYNTIVSSLAVELDNIFNRAADLFSFEQVGGAQVSLDEAKKFAEKKNISFEIVLPGKRKILKKSYSQNFFRKKNA